MTLATACGMDRHRVLVAGSRAEDEPLKTILGECEAHFVDAFAEAVALLGREVYSFVLVAINFAESRMFDFILEVRRQQPQARVVALRALEDAPLRAGVRAAVEFALDQIGVEGVVDLSAGVLTDKERRTLADLVELCRPKP
jgi:hypothetical protein